MTLECGVVLVLSLGCVVRCVEIVVWVYFCSVFKSCVCMFLIVFGGVNYTIRSDSFGFFVVCSLYL